MTGKDLAAFREAVSLIPEIRGGLVSVSLSASAGGVEIDSIWSEVERGAGHATRAMNAILVLADEHGFDVYAQPHWLTYDVEGYAADHVFPADEIDRMERLNEQRLDNEQLLAWYERLGFEVTDGRRGDDFMLIRRAHVQTPVP